MNEEMTFAAIPHKEHQKEAATLLDILTTTLKESWGVLLYVWVPSSHGLDINGFTEHREIQFQIAQAFLMDHNDDDDGFVTGYKNRAFQLLEELLRKELRFQSRLQQDVHSMIDELSPSHGCLEDLLDLLEYLHKTQTAISQRLKFISTQMDSRDIDVGNSIQFENTKVEAEVA